MKRVALLAALVAATSGCDSADQPPETSRLAGTYVLEVDGVGSFEGAADGFIHPNASSGLFGLSDVGTVGGAGTGQDRFAVSLTTNTLDPGRYGISPTSITINSDACETSARFEPGTVALTFTVSPADGASCHPAQLTGTVDVTSAVEGDVRFSFSVVAAPVGRSDTLAVRGQLALRSTGPLASGM